MKKLFTVLVTAVFVFCGAAQALAYFENSHLAQVVYNSTDKEVGVDLGDMDAFTFGPTAQVLAGPGSMNLGQFGSAVEGWDDLNLSMYTAYRTSGIYHFMFATTEETAPVINNAAKANFYNGSTLNHTLMSGAGAQVYVGAATEVSSYTNKLDLGAKGQMAGYNLANPAVASVNLAGLLTDGFVDMYLYEFDINGNLVEGQYGDYQGILRLNADGSTIAMAAPVPIPGALILFASGLVGLVGIRRRQDA